MIHIEIPDDIVPHLWLPPWVYRNPAQTGIGYTSGAAKDLHSYSRGPLGRDDTPGVRASLGWAEGSLAEHDG